MQKQCIKCSVLLDKTNTTWYRQKNYIHKCTPCMRDEKKKYARMLPAEIKLSRSKKCRDKLRKDNPVRYTANQMAGSAAKRARALGLDFNINADFIESICPDVCPVFGYKLKFGGGERESNSASIDRIDSAKGYTKDNVQIISYLANLMKNNATDEEQVMFANWVLKLKGKAK